MDQAHLPFLMLLARTMAMVELTPCFGALSIPRVVRIAIAVGLAALVAPLVGPTLEGASGGSIVGLILSELATGIMLGFLAGLVFEAAEMMGGLVELSMAPTFRGPVSNTYLACAACVFFLLGGHHAWLDVLVASYVVWPPTPMAAETGLQTATALANTVALAVLLALPAIATAWIVELLAAVLRRSSSSLRPLLETAPLRALAVTAIVALSLTVFATRWADEAIDVLSRFADDLEQQHVR